MQLVKKTREIVASRQGMAAACAVAFAFSVWTWFQYGASGEHPSVSWMGIGIGLLMLSVGLGVAWRVWDCPRKAYLVTAAIIVANGGFVVLWQHLAANQPFPTDPLQAFLISAMALGFAGRSRNSDLLLTLGVFSYFFWAANIGDFLWLENGLFRHHSWARLLVLVPGVMFAYWAMKSRAKASLGFLAAISPFLLQSSLPAAILDFWHFLPLSGISMGAAWVIFSGLQRARWAKQTIRLLGLAMFVPSMFLVSLIDFGTTLADVFWASKPLGTHVQLRQVASIEGVLLLVVVIFLVSRWRSIDLPLLDKCWLVVGLLSALVFWAALAFMDPASLGLVIRTMVFALWSYFGVGLSLLFFSLLSIRRGFVYIEPHHFWIGMTSVCALMFVRIGEALSWNPILQMQGLTHYAFLKPVTHSAVVWPVLLAATSVGLMVTYYCWRTKTSVRKAKFGG